MQGATMKRALVAAAAMALCALSANAQEDLALPGVAPAPPAKKKDAKKGDLKVDDLNLSGPLAPAKKADAKADAKKPAPAELKFDDPTADPTVPPAFDPTVDPTIDPTLDPTVPPPAAAKDARDTKKDARDAKRDVKKDAKGDAGLTGLDAIQKDDRKPELKKDTRPAPSGGLAGSAAGQGSGSGRAVVADRVVASPGQGLGGEPRVPLVPGPMGQSAIAPIERPLWNVSIVAGAERATEQYLPDTTSLTHLGLSGFRSFDRWQLRASLDFRSSKQGYVIGRPSSDGSSQPPTVLDEQRWEGSLGAGYDVGPRMVESGRLQFMPTLAFKYLTLQNDAFPTNLFGLEVGGRFAWELSSAVSAVAEGGYTFNFVNSDTESALGSPKGFGWWAGGLMLPLAGGYALELKYTGNVLAFQYVYRVAHGAALGFDVNF
jgi:hypothetical protein